MTLVQSESSHRRDVELPVIPTKPHRNLRLFCDCFRYDYHVFRKPTLFHWITPPLLRIFFKKTNDLTEKNSYLCTLI